jgi:hypothetical protein
LSNLVVKLLCELSGGLGVDVSIVLLASGDILGVVTLKSLNVEDITERASIRTGNTFDAHVEFTAIGGMGMAGIVTRLFHFSGIRAHETFGNL